MTYSERGTIHRVKYWEIILVGHKFSSCFNVIRKYIAAVKKNLRITTNSSCESQDAHDSRKTRREKSFHSDSLKTN